MAGTSILRGATALAAAAFPIPTINIACGPLSRVPAPGSEAREHPWRTHRGPRHTGDELLGAWSCSLCRNHALGLRPAIRCSEEPAGGVLAKAKLRVLGELVTNTEISSRTVTEAAHVLVTSTTLLIVLIEYVIVAARALGQPHLG